VVVFLSAAVALASSVQLSRLNDQYAANVLANDRSVAALVGESWRQDYFSELIAAVDSAGR
jgi:hypothetical protein